MPRPRKEDRSNVKDTVLTMKLSPRDRAQLHKLLEARTAELLELTGERITVTFASYLRWLMDRDAKARSIDIAEKTVVAAPEASPRRSRKTKR